MTNSLKKFFDDQQIRMFLFIKIFWAIGFCAIALPITLSGGSKALVELFPNFLFFYIPAIFLKAVVTYFSGKTKLGKWLFCEFIILIVILNIFNLTN